MHTGRWAWPDPAPAACHPSATAGVAPPVGGCHSSWCCTAFPTQTRRMAPPCRGTCPSCRFQRGPWQGCNWRPWPRPGRAGGRGAGLGAALGNGAGAAAAARVRQDLGLSSTYEGCPAVSMGWGTGRGVGRGPSASPQESAVVGCESKHAQRALCAATRCWCRTIILPETAGAAPVHPCTSRAGRHQHRVRYRPLVSHAGRLDWRGGSIGAVIKRAGCQGAPGPCP